MNWLGLRFMKDQIRYKQRLENFGRALGNLNEALALKKIRSLSKLETQGLLKSFEFTYELAWKSMKDYLEFQGITGIVGSRDSFRLAFQNAIIGEGEAWQEMVDDRNLLSHDYDESIANDIAERVDKYAKLLNAYNITMKQK